MSVMDIREHVDFIHRWQNDIRCYWWRL